MIAQQTNVDTIANNIANVNTNGYKTQRAEFKTLLYQTLQEKTTSANGERKPTSAQVGLGTRTAAIDSIYTQGEMVASDSDTAFAINGKGFFAILATDGETYYTRDGNFVWADGTNGWTLCTADGYSVLDVNGQQIVLPASVSPEAVQYSPDGVISYEVNGQQVMRTFGLYQFNNPTGLYRSGNNLLAVTEASGPALSEATTAGLTRSTVMNQYLEGSNVQVADEMVDLIIAQRAYELNSKAVQAADEMMEQANNLRR